MARVSGAGGLEKQLAEKCLLEKGSIGPIRSDDLQKALLERYLSWNQTFVDEIDFTESFCLFYIISAAKMSLLE